MTILKEYRINHDFVQKEMADKLKCSLPAYRNYENGIRTIPHEVLISFLRLRAKDTDIELANILEKLYKNESYDK